MRISKKRMLIAGSGLLGVGAVAMIVAGSTFGFFSASTNSGTNKFTAGTVVVKSTSAGSVVCTVHPMSPGDNATTGTNHAICKFEVTYTGSVPAWLGLDVAVTGTQGTSPTPYGSTTAPTAVKGLFNGTATKGLSLLVGDTKSTDFVSNSTKSGVGVDYFATTGAATSFPLNATATGAVKDLLVGSDISGPTTYTFSVTYSLPTAATNAYQAAATKLVFTFHAVQFNNNAATGGKCTTLGAMCPTSGTAGIHWS